MSTKTKYYNNVYLIYDENRKKKLQELFLRSVRNDMSKWSKIIRYVDKKISETNETVKVTDTDYYSPNYNGYDFQLDMDKQIGIVQINRKRHELVFDYEDYKGGKYPKEIKDPLVHLMKNVFVDTVKKIDILIPKTQTEVAEDIRNERSSKLSEIWGDKKE